MSACSYTPRISIVTPSFNQGHHLEETILSVIGQDYSNLDYIIIDGGSTDNSVDIIKKYQKHLSYWVSEPDKGQAHAIIKGLERATGEIFNWINSDDYLEPEALMAVGKAFAENLHAKIVCGYTYCFFDETKEHSHTYRMHLGKTATDTILRVQMNQPGSFYDLKTVKELGGVNESLRYVMDDELWFRFLSKYGVTDVVLTDARLANFRLHGNSKTVGEGFSGFLEERQSIYISLAEASGAPVWLIEKMKESSHSKDYKTVGTWDLTSLDKNKYIAYFATRYINSLYTQGRKELAKEAMKLCLKNGLFTWNRMMISLRTKLALGI